MSNIQKMQLFKRSMNGERISLHKLGYNLDRTDNQKLAYIRGYIKRKYNVKVTFPLDNIILFMIYDAILEATRE